MKASRVAEAAIVAVCVVIMVGFCLSMVAIWIGIGVVCWQHLPWPVALAFTFIQAFITMCLVLVVAES